MAEELLRDVDSMIPCIGFGKTGEFGVNLKYKEKTFDGRTFSPSCRGVASTPEKACPQCKHLRRLLLNRLRHSRRDVQGLHQHSDEARGNCCSGRLHHRHRVVLRRCGRITPVCRVPAQRNVLAPPTEGAILRAAIAAQPSPQPKQG
ncbi:hypothetical protein MRX96_055005 [Rhipicephalus microplus]